MPIKWTISVLMFMLLCTVIFAIVEKGSGTAYGTGVLETLSDITVSDVINPAQWVINVFSGDAFEWASALLNAVMFDYAMFSTGGWEYVRYFFWTISFGWLISLVITMMRGVGSV